jgi:hypothetical protein
MKKILLSGVLALGMAASAHATSITGGLHMTGVANLDNTMLGSATKVNSFAAVVTQPLTATGSYFGIGADAVTFAPFQWNPAVTPVNPLWSFVDAGTTWTYQFNLATMSVASQDNSFLNITGTGTLTITGAGSPYSTTFGSWSFTISNPGGAPNPTFNFGFDSANNALPDGGMTVGMLGIALTGLGLARRKIKI